MDKPVHVFDRTDEWSELERFSRARPDTQSLGLVHGRRRQGKSYLLEAFVEAHGGFYFTSLQQSSAQNLERLSSAYAAHARVGVPVRFSTWEQALTAVLALGEREETVVPVVIDEFPYLLADSPELPSLIQSLLRSRIAPRETGRAALILCGSALSTMRGLLAGTAALRGRASLEMLVHPFSFRDAARFWGVDADPDLSVRLHALLGGTPAYRDMCGGAIPTDAGFDQWVISTLLNPASAMQREGDILLAEENQISDLAPYYAVLAAISNGRTRRGEIASTLGRSTGALSHPLAVLVETGLVSVEEDALRDKRATFHIAEPILRFHQLIIDPNRGPLSRRRPGVWLAVTDTVSSQIYGPHFQHLSRTWCAEHASVDTLGGVPSRVASTVVPCVDHRGGHEVDVVVVERRPHMPDSVIAIGEAKWHDAPFTLSQLQRLDHAAALISADQRIKLLLFARRGFDRQVLAEAKRRTDIELIDTDRLYNGD